MIIKKEKNKWIRTAINPDGKYWMITYHSTKKEAEEYIHQIGCTRYEKIQK